MPWLRLPCCAWSSKGKLEGHRCHLGGSPMLGAQNPLTLGSTKWYWFNKGELGGNQPFGWLAYVEPSPNEQRVKPITLSPSNMEAHRPL